MQNSTTKRKATAGPIRNTDKTKKRLIDAVGIVISRHGYAGLSLVNIAKEAKVNMKLIYYHFGSLDNLIAIYVRSKDYWSNIPDEIISKINNSKTVEKEMIIAIMSHQFDYLFTSPEMQKIIIWEISQKNKLMREISDEREKLGSWILKKSDSLFKNTTIDFRAIEALLVSGIYYLILHAKTNGSTVCELDINQEKDRERIKNALAYLVNEIYADAGKQKHKKSKT